jgi:hypothetical protein
LVGAQGIINVGLCYVLLWFFFPHALLVPVMAVAVVLCLAYVVQPFRILLDLGGGELVITQAYWTRHVPLTRVTRVDAVARGADPDSPLPGDNGSMRGAGLACLFAAAGLLNLGVAALIRPQTGGRLVHDVALALRTLAGVGGAAVVLISAWMLFRTWRDQHAAGQPG